MSNIPKAKLREEYINLMLEALEIIHGMNIKDKNGKVLEYGHTIINKMLEMERMGKDITEQIEIIEPHKWLKLKEIWDKIKLIETVDK